MKTNSLFWALSWVAVGSFAVMQGCGGDDDDDGSGDGSTGGKGGSAGSATGGKGGSAGSATGGKGGSAGSATTGGTSGTAGTPGGAGGEGGNSAGGEGGGSGDSRAAVCAEYCDVYYATGCEAFDGGYYGTEAGCQTTCETSIWELGEPGDAAGNSVHCRLTHAGFAAEATDPTTHCGHAKAEPTSNCVP